MQQASFITPEHAVPYAEYVFGTRAQESGAIDDVVKTYAEHFGPVAHMRQVHGNRIVYAATSGTYEECDAIYTDKADLWVAVKTADCVPVLISSPHAVAAVHCGWRGLQAGILSKTLGLLMQEFGMTPTEMFVAIGPCIRQAHYEVEDTFKEEFDEKFFRPSDKKGKAFMNLAGVARAQAMNVGVNDLNIMDSNLCTFEDNVRFFSYRRAKQKGNEDTGVQLSLISRRVG